MTTAYDVPQQDLIEVAHEELKKVDALKPPEWALFAKSGASRERPPQQPDFWQWRAAALLRKIYTKGPIGVSRLQTAYGSKKNRGSQPSKHYKGSGSVIRVLLQQLETAGYVKNTKKGRVITPSGQKFLDNIAHKVEKNPIMRVKKVHEKRARVAHFPGSEKKEEPHKKKWESKDKKSEAAAEDKSKTAEPAPKN